MLAPAPAAGPSPHPVARPEPLCPLCGQANGCTPARLGHFEQPCWCETVQIAPAVLARLTPAQQGCACLCRSCATAAARPPTEVSTHQPPG